MEDPVRRVSSNRVMIPVSLPAGLPERLCVSVSDCVQLLQLGIVKGAGLHQSHGRRRRRRRSNTDNQTDRRGREQSKEKWRTEIYIQPKGKQGASWRKHKSS